jgi:proteasome lid subunit RPN8/RPN11
MKIVIPHQLDAILSYLVEAFDNEFTLFGKTRVDYETEEVHLVEIRVPEQESASSTTEADQGSFLEELIEAGENPEDWNMWIHSHNNFGAFFSGTDDDTMQSFNRGNTTHFWHMVISEKGRKAAYTMYKPFNMKMSDVKIEISGNEGLSKEMDKLIKKQDKLMIQLEKIEKEVKEQQELEKNLVPDEALTYEQQLETKNKVSKPFSSKGTKGGYRNPKFSKDKNGRSRWNWWDEDDDVKEITGVKGKYDIFDRNARAKRIESLMTMLVDHKHTCKCPSCIELLNLRYLEIAKTKVNHKTLKSYLNGTHPIDCQCKTCETGRAIQRIQTLIKED